MYICRWVQGGSGESGNEEEEVNMNGREQMVKIGTQSALQKEWRKNRADYRGSRSGQWLEVFGFGFEGRVAGHDGLLVEMIAGVKLFPTGFAVA